MKIDLETSLRFAEQNGFLGARQRIWELEEEVEACHEGQRGWQKPSPPPCRCDACEHVRSRRKDRD